MGCSPLVDANRRLIEAIETPPDSGLEQRLDEMAATLWAMEQGGPESSEGPPNERTRNEETREQRGPPDPGACCRVRQKLRTLERRADDHRRAHVAEARRAVEAYGETLEAV